MEAACVRGSLIGCDDLQAGQWQAGPTSRASQELPADVGPQQQRHPLPLGMRPLFAAPQGAGPSAATRTSSGVAETLRHTVSGVNMPDGLTLEDLLRLGEEIVPGPNDNTVAAAEAGAKLEDLNPMQLAAFLASKVPFLSRAFAIAAVICAAAPHISSS